MNNDNEFFFSMIQIELVINSLMMNHLENIWWWIGLKHQGCIYIRRKSLLRHLLSESCIIHCEKLKRLTEKMGILHKMVLCEFIYLPAIFPPFFLPVNNFELDKCMYLKKRTLLKLIVCKFIYSFFLWKTILG